MLFLGTDFGTSKTVTSYKHETKFDLLLTKTGSRYLPSMVTYLPETRLFSEKSKTRLSRDRPRTISCLRLLLHYSNQNSLALKNYLQSHKIVDNKIQVNSDEVISVYESLYSFFIHLNELVLENFIELPLHIAISYPSYYTSKDISNFYSITKFASNVYSEKRESLITPSIDLISDLTAVSYYYGITKSNAKTLFSKNYESEESKNSNTDSKSVCKVLFIDFGKSSTQLCLSVYSESKGNRLKCSVEIQDYISQGGNYFDSLIFEMITSKDEEYSTRETVKRLLEAEKVKKKLTVGERAVARFELEDEDIEIEVNRSDFYKKLDSYRKNLESKIFKILEISERDKKINSKSIPNFLVEFTGGMCRVPLLKEIVDRAVDSFYTSFNENLNQEDKIIFATNIEARVTMNEHEACSSGCTLYAATASKIFKSSCSIQEKIDLDKFNFFEKLNDEDGAKSNNMKKEKNEQKVDITYKLFSLAKNENEKEQMEKDFKDSKEFRISGFLKENDYLPVAKNISISTRKSIYLSFGINTHLLRSFVIESPEKRIETLTASKSLKDSLIIKNIEASGHGKLNTTLTFEANVDLGYSPNIRNPKIKVEYLEISPYGQVQKYRRDFLLLEIFRNKKNIRIPKIEDIKYFGINKRVFTDDLIHRSIETPYDISSTNLEKIKENEIKYQKRDADLERAKELRNKIETKIIEMESRAVKNETITAVMQWVYNEGMSAGVKELEDKLDEIEKAN